METASIFERSRVDWRDVLGLLVVTAVATLIALRSLPSSLDTSPVGWLASAAFPFGAGALVVAFMVGSARRKRNIAILQRNDATTVLLSDKPQRAINGAGIAAMTPQFIVWANTLGPDTNGSFWGFAPLLAYFVVTMIRDLIKQGGPIVLDRTGIRHPDLWEGALLWSEIRDIRVVKGNGGEQLAIDLYSPSTFAKKGSANRRNISRDELGTLLVIASTMFRAPAADVASFMRNRLSIYGRGGRASI